MRLNWLAVVFAVGLILAPLAVEAQPAVKVPRIGLLMGGSSGRDSRVEAFRQGFRELGYIEGQTIAIEWRFAEGQEARLAPLVAELIRLKVDVIVTDGNQATGAAKSATKTVPIVIASDSDPVGMGTVASLARPGGNITGLTNFLTGLSQKRLEVLRDALPGISRVGIIWNPENPQSGSSFQEAQIAARALGLRVQSLEVRGPGDFEGAFQAATKGRAGALSVLSDALMFAHRTRVLALAAKHKLPTIHTQSLWVEAGGLMSYGTHFPDLFRRAATYVDKILKGAKPADLPIEQPTKFELVINLKTAKALGLTIPPALLLRADRVIE
jgi:ABC-type uncharacterized transport system substrate-binding protein